MEGEYVKAEPLYLEAASEAEREAWIAALVAAGATKKE